MKKLNFKRTKYACFYTYVSGASVFALPPLLFLTFREMYGISYTLLGTLVLINFCTQLGIDLIFTFFTKYFNIHRTVKIMPVITTLGLLIYAIYPMLFPGSAYVGLVTGTIIFSVSAGLSEVLLSPFVAAIPSDNPDRDMSFLHSLYAWGVVMVVTVTTVFFNVFGAHNWMYLTMFFAALPLISCFLFCTSPMPEMNIGHNEKSSGAKSRNMGLILCVGCIFLGGATENVMTNWISGFMETALNIPKSYGDIFGMAVFALLLGFGRTLYAKFGKNISLVILCGMTGAAICYLVAGFTTGIVALLACILTGFCSSMLWPGTLILMEEKIPNPGVAAYALMAAGGDFGSSVAPQLMGIIVDNVAVSEWAKSLSQTLLISPDQIGMKTGMLVASLFPIVGIVLLIFIRKYFSKRTAK